jgi:hypothetical protein
MGERKTGKAIALPLSCKCAKRHDMNLTAQIKLHPTPEQHDFLQATLEEANAACNWISQEAFREGVFGQFSLHKIVYHPARERFDLSAQMVVRAIAKVADAYKISQEKAARLPSSTARFPMTAASCRSGSTQERCPSGRWPDDNACRSSVAPALSSCCKAIGEKPTCAWSGASFTCSSRAQWRRRSRLTLTEHWA